MKKIILLFVFVINYFSFSFLSKADFIICDSGNINLSGKTVSEICNGGYENTNIDGIESFTGNYIDIDPGFLGNNTSINKNEFYNLPTGFFNSNIETIIKKEIPNYDTPTGFFGSIELTDKNIDLDKNFSIGFFDSIKTTKIENTNPNYITPVGFFGSYSGLTDIETVKTLLENSQTNITFKEFYISIFKKYSNSEYIKYSYSSSEYDIFIKNLVDLLLKSSNATTSSDFISENDKNRIELYIENSNFKTHLSKLMENMKDINSSFLYSSSDRQKIYILNYFLNENNN